MPGASTTVDTPASYTPPSSPRPWLGAALAVAVVAACWLGAMLYWRAVGTAPSAMAMAQLRVALPAGVLLSLWMGKSALSRAATAPAQPAGAAADATAAEARKQLPAIAACAVRMRGGESAAELAETLRTNAAPCALDPELVDAAGYPVLSGRAACADPGAARESMEPWLAQRGMAELEFSDEGWRALSMAAAVAVELAQHALMHPVLQAWVPEYLAATKDERTNHPQPMLQLLALLPDNWHASQRQAAADWLLHLIAQQGWPVERLGLSAGFTAGPGAGFALLDTLALASGLTLLLACDSSIGDDSVRELGQRGLLFSGKTGRGQVPGEGACALLLLDGEQQQKQQRLATDTLVVIDGASSGRRPSSADDGGSIGASLLAGLVSEALGQADVGAAAMAAIWADADFRPNRTGEVMSMGSSVFPDLSPEAAPLGVGAGCGTTGAAGTLAALALAAQEALACGAPVLCVSNSDSHYRCALLVRPAEP